MCHVCLVCLVLDISYWAATGPEHMYLPLSRPHLALGVAPCSRPCDDVRKEVMCSLRRSVSHQSFLDLTARRFVALRQHRPKSRVSAATCSSGEPPSHPDGRGSSRGGHGDDVDAVNCTLLGCSPKFKLLH